MTVWSCGQRASCLLLHEWVRSALILIGELPVGPFQGVALLLRSDRVAVSSRISRHIRSERVSVWRCEVVLTDNPAVWVGAVREALLIPGRSTRAILPNRVPIPNVLDRYHSARISICLPPSVCPAILRLALILFLWKSSVR